MWTKMLNESQLYTKDTDADSTAHTLIATKTFAPFNEMTEVRIESLPGDWGAFRNWDTDLELRLV